MFVMKSVSKTCHIFHMHSKNILGMRQQNCLKKEHAIKIAFIYLNYFFAFMLKKNLVHKKAALTIPSRTEKLKYLRKFRIQFLAGISRQGRK